MRSRAASASGSATVVVRQRFLHLPSRPAWRISLVTLRLPAADVAMHELLVDPRGAIGALGLGVDGGDLLAQLGVGELAGRRDAVAALVVGGLGDLEQATGVCTLWPATSSASMNGSTFIGSPERRKPLHA